MNQNAAETKAESVDIKEYFAILLKRKWLVLICFLLSLAATTGFLFTRQQIWRANANLLVTTAGGGVLVSEITMADERSFYTTELSIMQSQTMLKRVQSRMKKTTTEIKDNLIALTIQRSRGGANIISISVDSPSREFAKDFANDLADEYLRYREEQRAQTSESALLMLTREINRLSQEAKAANDRMLLFAKDHNLALLEDSYNAYQQQYKKLREDFSAAQLDLQNAMTRKQLLDAHSDAASIIPALQVEHGPVAPPSLPGTDGANSESNAVPGAISPPPTERVQDIQNSTVEEHAREMGPVSLALNDSRAEKLFELESQRRILEARLDEMHKLFKAGHPAVREAELRVKDIQSQIDEEIRSARERANVYLKIAQAKYDQLRKQIEEIDARALNDVLRIQELTAMKGEVKRIQTLYDTLIQKLTMVDVSAGFNQRNVTVLENALLEDEPIYPKKVKGLLMSAFIGLGLGLAIAFFIEYIDDSIKLAEEVERDLQIPFLGMIPSAMWDPDDMSAHRLDKIKQQGGVSEAYRVVRSAIMFSAPREKLQTILVASAVPREGKSTSCVNLAIGFSQVDERVLLVDADMRRGTIHKYFNFEKDKGLADILLGEATPEDVVRHTDVPRLDVITTGAYPANPAELLLGWRLKEFLDWARKNYDRVIIDGTPIMGIADSSIVGAAVDGVLFLIWAGRTSRRYVRVAKMTAAGRGAKIFGFILNNLEPGRVGYYHYYPYYYSYYSRGYYYSTKDEEKEKAKGGDIKGMPAGATEPTESQIDDVY